MPEKTPIAKRAAQFAALTVGGGVALTFAFAGSASADDVTVQDAEVTNAGAAAANSGGNVAVGNASDNTASSTQQSNGFIASNNGTANNTSNGSASITTGQATASGSQATTHVDQQSDSGDSGPGPDVAVQNTRVVNAGAAASNSGGNVAIGNASRNEADNDQDADGALASNVGGANNASDGTAAITTGAATAVGNLSSTHVDQDAASGDGAGLVLVVQNSDVLNLGLAAANSGGNIGIGNFSDNEATNDQDADGLFASNLGGAKNASDGMATIKTGKATATGNTSATDIDQDADTGNGAGLALVVQNTDVLNLGVAVANSGGNIGIGNFSDNLAVNGQGALGLIASNVGNAGNASDGTSSITTGDATALGNVSTTKVDQDADADTAGLAIVVQHAPVLNAGIGLANSGLNIGIGNDALDSAIVAQVSFGLLASNVSDSSNLSDGFAMLLTGSASGIGNQAATVVEQDA